jgi:CelD/BcsL family acetyltransferase involved in cellulose biosynthesis
MRARALAATGRREAGEAWSTLEADIDDSGAMCSWEWTEAWLEHYGDLVHHSFVIGEEEGEVRGVALITHQSMLRRVRPPTIALGTAGEPPGSSVFVERNRLVARPSDRARFAAALMDELARWRGWQRLSLDGMLPEDVRALAASRRLARWEPEECPIADLRTLDADGLSSELPGRRRRRVAQSLARLEGAECEWARDAAEASELLEELIDLHQARWQADGRPGAFASSRFAGFHRTVAQRLVPRGRAALFRVRTDGTTVACLYGLLEGRRMLFYQSGTVRDPDSRVNIGLAAHVRFMQACRERGLEEYDFLAPATRYKLELSNRSETLVWAALERPGARLHLERAARGVKRRLTAQLPRRASARNRRRTAREVARRA